MDTVESDAVLPLEPLLPHHRTPLPALALMDQPEPVRLVEMPGGIARDPGFELEAEAALACLVAVVCQSGEAVFQTLMSSGEL